ncbi:MAG: phosphoribosyltransferase family protein, partial [bacterium]|nr:phosphoribosyltransferase family protein [bacterium]
MFDDRRDAGRRLAEALLAYRLPAQAGGKDAVVVGLPRGGVAVAAEVARILGLPLDIIAVRKIGHPGAPEYALGAVDETGERFLNEADAASIDPAWIE